ncbi:hypothetical protein TMatcc_008962 [Talaromyces marneffei ATCC 18224]|nr:uncharacterized protein EYB26_008267 [Talaromyces marneffei]KAE8550896.1 hypothetical protein EYB25_007128 [Talaromyces marneffei]QGA20561.1 hypothetical protein EYB26_008267 [Talaromyces marneffei]
MAYPYMASSRAFRFPHSTTLPKIVEEHRLDGFSNFHDSDSSSTTTLATDNLQVLKLPTRLIIALTCGFAGLQLVWSSIFSHGTAYLYSLGSSKSQSSLIWAIGPICGTVVQPIVGAIADNSRIRWGRRRPFILGGAIGTAISLIALAWVSNIMHALAATVNIHSDEGVKTMTQIGIIVCITFLNLSIQPLQSGLRALIVDICPSEQQSVASAWAGCFSGFSNILGYILGSLPLGIVSHDNEVWRFRFLALVSVAALGTTVLLAVYFIREEDPREFVYAPEEGMLLVRVLRTVKNSWSSMPAQSQRVCLVQFFAWMGWFGFLFYSTSYVGRLYMTESQRRGVEHFYQRDVGIRRGTFANLLSAVTALATMVIAPYVASTNSVGRLSEKPILQSRSRWWRQTHIIWAMSHLLYAFCAFCTFFISSTNTAVLVIAVAGISWGVTQWAPFALLGEEIAISQAGQDPGPAERGGVQWMSSQSGAKMGIHNAAISIPQILAAVASSFVFVIFEGDRSDGDSGIVWVLRISGLAALVAAYFAWQLR